MLFLQYLGTLLCFILLVNGVPRASFDIGSGATKLLVADFDVATGTITKNLFEKEILVGFKNDVINNRLNNRLSDSIMDKGLAVMHELVTKAIELGATEAAAIATDVFRKASNGEEYLARVKAETGITVRIVTQDMEANLGLRTAEVLTGTKGRPVWDSGGGSFQITYRDANSVQSYVGQIGLAEAVRTLRVDVKNTSATVNPVTVAEADATVKLIKSKIPPPPAWLKDATVVGIGGTQSIFGYALRALRGVGADTLGATLTVPEIEEALASTVNRENSSLEAIAMLADEVNVVVPQICLILAVATTCGISKVEYVPASGSCAGLLVEGTFEAIAVKTTSQSFFFQVGVASLIILVILSMSVMVRRRMHRQKMESALETHA